ncbi:MAG: TetR/AcrR family transcriptional regulator [SAR324 cluster bacterium]|nr:TetR/AcrR family transcriptional regulator [SAR324 cluster bacterium]
MEETKHLNTKSKILEGVRSYLIKNGSQNFSARSVAKAAGVNHGLIHHYFGSKEKLILAFIDYFDQQVENKFKEKVKGIKEKSELAVIINELMLDPSVSSVVVELLPMGKESTLIRERMNSLIQGRIELMAQMLEIRDRRDAVMMVGMVIGMVFISQVDAELTVEPVIKRFIEKIEEKK